MGNSHGGMVKRRIASTHSPKQAESEGDCDVVVDMEHPTGTVPSVCDSSQCGITGGVVNEKSNHIQ